MASAKRLEKFGWWFQENQAPGEAASHWKGLQLSPLFLSRTDGCGFLSSAHGDANRPVLHWQKHLHSTPVGPRLSGPSNWARTHHRQVCGGLQGRHGSSGLRAKVKRHQCFKTLMRVFFFGIGKECIFCSNLEMSKSLKHDNQPNGYGSIPINTIFRGMNIHLPAILMFTRGTRFWHTAKWAHFFLGITWLAEKLPGGTGKRLGGWQGHAFYAAEQLDESFRWGCAIQ